MKTERTWNLRVNEEELKALIIHHASAVVNTPFEENTKAETTARLHDLTKRLNKAEAEGENGEAKVEVKPEVPAAWGT